MSFSNVFENDLLQLIFNAVAIANIADDAGASPLTDLYVSLHTADPGEGGDQTTNECAYTSYAREATTRDNTGWTVTDNSASPAANIDFTEATGGSETATHIGIGTAASGTGKLLASGPLGSPIAISAGTIPRITTATAVTLD